MLVNWKSPNTIIALALIAFGMGIFLYALIAGLGGAQAVFLILGYVAGWISSVVLFFYRKSPPKQPPPGGGA
jgi:hypothetical protein